MPAQHTLGQRPPVLLKAFTCLQASWVPVIATSSYHPNGIDEVERVNHMVAQMLAMVNELQNNWDEQLPHVDFAYNNSVSSATDLTPNEVNMGRLPRLPLTISERSGVSPATRAWPATISPTATWRQTASRAQMISSANTMPSQFLTWNVKTQLSPTHCARFPHSPLAARCGRIKRLPPSGTARRWMRTPRSSRPSSRSTGRALTKSSQLAPVPSLTPLTATLSALSPYPCIFPPTYPVRMFAGALR